MDSFQATSKHGGLVAAGEKGGGGGVSRLITALLHREIDQKP